MKTPSLAEAEDILNPMARKIGAIYGVDLFVGRLDGRLMFVDGAGDLIVDPWGTDGAVCVAQPELADGTFLKVFAGRSLYAALLQRFNALESVDS